MTNLCVGDEAPSFAVNDEKGKLITSGSLRGNKYILFFYPKDDTPGCTNEACSIRDKYASLENLGYNIYGISPDSERKHQKFINKYGFQYSLLSDPEKKMIRSFGVWGPKKFLGREYMGVHRTTFIVDECGFILKVLKEINTKNHGQEIIEAIESMTGE